MRMSGNPHAPLPSLNPRPCTHLVGGSVNPDFADEIISCPSRQSNQDSFVVPPIPLSLISEWEGCGRKRLWPEEVEEHCVTWTTMVRPSVCDLVSATKQFLGLATDAA
jgi:hypothetical protein